MCDAPLHAAGAAPPLTACLAPLAPLFARIAEHARAQGLDGMAYDSTATVLAIAAQATPADAARLELAVLDCAAALRQSLFVLRVQAPLMPVPLAAPARPALRLAASGGMRL